MIPQINPPPGNTNKLHTNKFRPTFGTAPPPGAGIGGPNVPMAPAGANGPSFGTAPQGGSIGGPGGPMTPYSPAQTQNAAATDSTSMSPMTGAPGRSNMLANQGGAPTGIQTPAPGTGGNTNPAWGPQGGVSPFNASSGATGVGEFQRFADASYDRQVGRLTPQFEAQERGFEQDMVNRGIAPGTPAYDNARQNFEQSRNDAFEGARTQADQLGAAMQQQSFGQGESNSRGLRELLLGQMGADASRFGATTSANASMNNANTAAQSAADRLRYDQQQGDFGNLMSLLGFGMGVNGQNNATQGQNFNQNAWMAGQIPGMQQPGNLDVTSGYNNQYNAGLNQSQWQQQQNNSNNQAMMQAFAAMYCDRNAKDEIAAAAPEDALTAITGLPYATWTYKADVEKVPHVGTYAQDFNAALGLPANLTISPIDLMGALIGSVQALTARVKELEAA